MFLSFSISEALVHYGSFLTEYEKKEIASYSEIWFLGLKACKIRGEENAGYNFGFDDENGNYNKVRIRMVRNGKRKHVENLTRVSEILKFRVVNAVLTSRNRSLCKVVVKLLYRLRYTYSYRHCSAINS